MEKNQNVVTGMDQFLWDRYEQLRQIHERLEDLVHAYRTCRDFSEVSPRLHNLTDDVRKWRDDAKHEYDTF